jgi:hypothetical protein
LFGSGGSKRQAEELDIPFLGTIPINLSVRKLADEGIAIIWEDREADISSTILQMVGNIEKMLETKI